MSRSTYKKKQGPSVSTLKRIQRQRNPPNIVVIDGVKWRKVYLETITVDNDGEPYELRVPLDQTKPQEHGVTGYFKVRDDQPS